MTFSVIVLIIFSLALVLIGIYAAKVGAKTAEDYFVAGRSIGLVATLFGLMATQMSAFAFMGMAASAYITGIGAMTQAIGVFIAVPFMYYTYRQVWKMGKTHGYITQADYLVDRYESPTFMRVFPPLLAMTAMIGGHFSTQFIATGLIFNVLSNGTLPYWFGVVFTAVIVVLIVVLGGFRATAWTDILLGSWIIVAFILIVVFTLGNLGMGFGAAFQAVGAKFPAIVSLPGPTGYWSLPMLISWLIVLSGFLLYPQMWMRAYAAKSPRVLQISGLVWTPMIFILTAMPIILGLFIRLFWPNPQQLGFPPDAAIVMLITKISPFPWLIPLLLIGVLAAIISTVNGNVIAMSAMITHDFIRCKLRPNMSSELSVSWGRVIVMLATVAAVIIAMLRPALIFQLIISAFGIMLLFLIPAVGGMLWSRLNRQGATWGWLISAVALLWMIYGSKSFFGGFLDRPAWLGLQVAIWAFLIQIVVTVVVTLLTPPPSAAVNKKFFNQRDQNKVTTALGGQAPKA